MHNEATVMLKILECAVQDKPLPEKLGALPDEEFFNNLYELSVAHDMAHIVGSFLEKYEILSEGKAFDKFKEQEFTAVYRYERLNFEYTQICERLEKAQIAFMPLKGAVLREIYPEPWMRTSCDIDILVHKEDLEKASKVLEEEMNYTMANKGTHDITYRSLNGTFTELHFDLVEDNHAKDSYKVLKSIWENSHTKKNYEYFYIMNPDMFYFYHIAHIAKHFEIGGCGIRPLLDLWLLNNKENARNDRIEKLLKQGGLLRFSNALSRLSEVWFSGEEHDETTLRMQTYILQGGVYGTEENYILMKNHRAGGRKRYILSRIFVPYSDLKYEFPLLQRCPLLTPFVEIYRWFAFLFNRKKEENLKRLNSTKYMPEEYKKNVADMMKKIGL